MYSSQVKVDRPSEVQQHLALKLLELSLSFCVHLDEVSNDPWAVKKNISKNIIIVFLYFGSRSICILWLHTFLINFPSSFNPPPMHPHAGGSLSGLFTNK